MEITGHMLWDETREGVARNWLCCRTAVEVRQSECSTLVNLSTETTHPDRARQTLVYLAAMKYEMRLTVVQGRREISGNECLCT